MEQGQGPTGIVRPGERDKVRHRDRNRGTDGWEPGEGQERGQGDTDRDGPMVITTGTGTRVEGRGQLQRDRNRNRDRVTETRTHIGTETGGQRDWDRDYDR